MRFFRFAVRDIQLDGQGIKKTHHILVFLHRSLLISLRLHTGFMQTATELVCPTESGFICGGKVGQGPLLNINKLN